MVPFCAFCYGHQRGATVRVVERIVKSPVGGIDPKIRPADRGGFPSGGANLPSFSLIPVQRQLTRRLTQRVSEQRIE
eukprot:12010849-Ditylum_brightwellii.AAC.1